MDFDDLLVNWLTLLRNEPDALREYSERFLHVLVDEYQDTNRLQAAILDLLGSRHRNLMVVGDDHQSIYSFRGANFENILRFPDRYPDAKLFKLETNYRSTPQILDLANRSIVRNRDQFRKELRAVRKGGFKPVYVRCATSPCRRPSWLGASWTSSWRGFPSGISPSCTAPTITPWSSRWS
jgi:DNA helicase-2/ATP-dependent DNA helicase PcrA